MMKVEGREREGDGLEGGGERGGDKAGEEGWRGRRGGAEERRGEYFI
jgi:hypothetical protein